MTLIQTLAIAIGTLNIYSQNKRIVIEVMNGSETIIPKTTITDIAEILGMLTATGGGGTVGVGAGQIKRTLYVTTAADLPAYDTNQPVLRTDILDAAGVITGTTWWNLATLADITSAAPEANVTPTDHDALQNLQNIVAVLGNIASAQAPDDTGNYPLMSFVKRISAVLVQTYTNFGNGVFKIKFWDGTNTAGVTDASQIKAVVENTVAISATSLPLAPDAATATGQTAIVNEEQAINLALGEKTDTTAADDEGNYSALSFIKRNMLKWTTLLTGLTNGTFKLMFWDGTNTAEVTAANQVKVVVENTVDIAAASLPLAPNAATAAGQTSIIEEGQAINLVLGSKTDATAADDEGTYSLLSFVKRNLVRWSALLTGLTSGTFKLKLWDGTNTASVNASGEVKIVGSPTKVSTETLSSQPGNITQITLLAANTNRLSYSIFNESYFASLYVAHGASVSKTSYKTIIPPQGYWEQKGDGIYTGQIVGLWNCPQRPNASAGTAKISQGT